MKISFNRALCRGFVRRFSVVSVDFLGLLISYLILRQNKIHATVYFYKVNANGMAERIDSGVDWYFVLVSVAVLILFVIGFYGERRSIWDEVGTLVKAFFFMIMFDFIVLFLAGYTWGQFYFVASWLGTFLFVLGIRSLFRWMWNLVGLWRIPTVVIGSEANIGRAIDAVSKQAAVGYAISAVIQICPSGSDSLPGPETGQNSHNMALDEIAIYLREQPNVHVVLASDERFSDEFYELTDFLASRPNTLDVLPSIKGLPLYGTDIIHLFGEEILMLRVRNNLARRVPQLFKRVFDVVLSLALVVALLPVFLILAVLIKLEDGGGPLYTQMRVGRDGRLFPCYKFRSMHVDAEQILARWEREHPDLFRQYKDGNFKLRNDPRVTRIGRFIRAHSLDELPQLINVLVGHMALIGPRPLIERELADYGNRIIHYYRARPGITGLWQVSGRSETRFADRASYDEWYVKNWSIWLDIVILVKTVGVVFGRSGAY